jgi:hypothetical protein
MLVGAILFYKIYIYTTAMSKFDLNLKNYTKVELEEMFQLTPTYTDTDLLQKEQVLRENILSDGAVDQIVKIQTLKFIEQAKQMLLSDKAPTLSVATIKPEPAKVPTQIYMPTHPSEYFPGWVNPVKKRNRNIVLNIDTRFRESYYVTQSSNFHINLPMKINSVVTMELSAIEFPPTAFYSVSKMLGNNFFWLRAGSTAASDLEEIAVIIPDGNFTASNAVDLINTFLQTQTTTSYLQYIYFSVNENATGTSGSSQLLVAVNESYPYMMAPPFNFIIDLQADITGAPDYSTPLPLKLGWKLGFRNGIYINNSAYVSEGVLNLAGASYLYLAIDDYNNANNTFFSAFNESLLNKNILARVAVQSSVSAAVTFSNIGLITTPREYYGPVNIEKMQIQMLDEYGRIINLNNMDYSFCLTFTTGEDVPTMYNAPAP